MMFDNELHGPNWRIVRLDPNGRPVPTLFLLRMSKTYDC